MLLCERVGDWPDLVSFSFEISKEKTMAVQDDGSKHTDGPVVTIIQFSEATSYILCTFTFTRQNKMVRFGEIQEEAREFKESSRVDPTTNMAIIANIYDKDFYKSKFDHVMIKIEPVFC